MTGSKDPYDIRFLGAAQRAIQQLPEKIAAAALEFCTGPLAAAPFRVGKPLFGQLAGRYGARRGEYRVVYTIEVKSTTVFIYDIVHRRDAYRSR